MTALIPRRSASPGRLSMQIETAAGPVRLRKPVNKKLQELSKLIPLRALGENHPSGAEYGVVMQYASHELMAIKQQSVEVKQSQCEEAYSRNITLLVAAIGLYRAAGFSGALMPCVYIRPKPKRLVEVGFAYFGAAGPGDAARNPKGAALAPLEITHGAGFGGMVMTFIECLGQVSRETGIPLAPIIDMDHRPRSLLNTLFFSFIIHGQDLYSLKIKPTPIDPVWEIFHSTGLREAYALPSVPLQIEEGPD